jgi:arylsulfate sulfotransferase
MRQLLTPFRKRVEDRYTQARRSRRHRPHCTLLEDRCLLSVSLTHSGPPVPLVGSPVIWTATASGDGSTPVYQFSVGPAGGASNVVRDFSPSNSFTWNPLQEGTDDIQVIVKDGYSSSTSESASATYTAQTRIVGTSAVISPMSNPLVALYSAPPSPGASMYVQFAQQVPSPSWTNTAPLPIVAGESTNFIVAGMLPNTTYLMRHVLDNGTVSAPLTFTTGSLPTGLTFPTFTVQQAPLTGTDLSQNIVFHAAVANQATTTSNVTTLATDLNGNITWYYDPMANNFPGYALNLEPGGTAMMLGGKSLGVAGGFDTARETDLAGDTLRETNIYAVNAELAALGQPSIIDFDHEVKLLPNGDTAVLATTQKIVTHKGNPTKFNGNMVIVLDQNFQVAWVWNAFNWLSTSRLGTDGEGPLDWLHGNSISYSPADGNLIVSLRAQDWVIKIAYSNGTGDGHLVWKLGKGGNFTLKGLGPDSWFSHQHDVRYINATTIVLFDDGNTRHKSNHKADSRGQELVLNEQTMHATLVVNADLGNHSAFLGSAQVLPNGNLTFTSGGQGSFPNLFGQSIEVLPNGTTTYVLKMSGYEYRSYFEGSLY